MPKLSFFTDEATQDFMTAVKLAKRLRFDGLELRSVANTQIDRIDEKRLIEYKHILDEEGLCVSNLASSFFKCELNDKEGISKEHDKLKRLCEAGNILDCKTIRGFCFFKNGSLEDALDEIISEFEAPISILIKEDKLLLLESDPSVYTANHKSLVRVLERLNSDKVFAIYDPGNDIYDPEGEIPFPDGYNAVKKYIRHIHIKDAVRIKGTLDAECVKIGSGEVDYHGLLTALKNDGYNGFCSLETHYRKDYSISDALMKTPGGDEFSRGGMEATIESAEVFKNMLDNVELRK